MAWKIGMVKRKRVGQELNSDKYQNLLDDEEILNIFKTRNKVFQ